MDELDRARKLYETQYKIDWHNRNYQWHPRNPISLIHAHLLEDGVVAALNELDIDLVDHKVLDLGCGYGRMLRFFAELGASPANLYGFDLSFYRLQRAHELAPDMGISSGSAGDLPYPAGYFHMVTQFSVFSSIHDSTLRKKAASEIERILEPGGWLVWYDIASSKGGNIIPLNRSQVLDLFPKLNIKFECPIFSTMLSRLTWHSPRLAIILEQLPIFPRTGLIVVLEKTGH